MPLLLLALLGCGSPTASPAAPDAPAAVTPDAPAAPAIARGDGKAYDGKWLVLLSSSKEPGQMPESVATLKASALPHHVARLASTEFKGLMPCYEVVVADAFDAQADALAYSKQLATAGVDNYAKLAGKWVGPQPKLEAWCAGALAPEAPVCEQTLRFAEQHEDRTFVHLGLDDALTERVSEGATPARTVGRRRSAWVSELPAKTVGDFAVGQQLFVSDKNGVRSCALTSFVLLTRGTPHFGYYESSDQSRPGCGEPEVFAEVGCKTIDAGLASATAFTAAQGVELPPAHALLAKSPFPSSAEWKQAAQRAQQDADALGEPLELAVKGYQYELDGKAYVGVYARWTTGDGVNICGADAVNIELFGVFDGQGAVVLPLQPTADFFEGATLYKAPNGALLAEVRAWNTRRVQSRERPKVCQLDYPYCDCAC